MILRLGTNSDEVKRLQEKLNAYFHDKPALELTGVFDVGTDIKVRAFQKDKGLCADGIVGPKTFMAIGMDSWYPELIEAPTGYDEIVKTFGEPWIDGWRQMFLVKIPIPRELCHVAGWEKGYFWGNRVIADKFIKVFDMLIAYPDSCKYLKTFGGCFNIRKSRTSEKWSTHSWAIAIDLNAETNALGSKGDMDPKVVECFKHHGFVWGGEFHGTCDPQHFQYARGY